MKKFVILISFVCCFSVVKSQDCAIELFLVHLELTERAPTPVEFVGLGMMSVGGCMVGVEHAYPQDQRRLRDNSVTLTGTALMVTGFVTYLFGTIRFNDRQVESSN